MFFRKKNKEKEIFEKLLKRQEKELDSLYRICNYVSSYSGLNGEENF